jgi:dihydroxy-acid dehydratase
MELLKLDLKPRDIMTRKAFENAIRVVIALAGSTNAVLHLLAMAHAVDVELTLDDFVELGKVSPVVADLRPSGKYMMSELVAIGGIQPLMKRMLAAGMLHGDVLTVTGKTSRKPRARPRLPGRPGRDPALRPTGQEGLAPGDPARQSRPPVPWPRSPARKACALKARHGSTTAKKMRWRASSTVKCNRAK